MTVVSATNWPPTSANRPIAAGEGLWLTGCGKLSLEAVASLIGLTYTSMKTEGSPLEDILGPTRGTNWIWALVVGSSGGGGVGPVVVEEPEAEVAGGGRGGE